jgi:outer membrane protein assembly factor BamB
MHGFTRATKYTLAAAFAGFVIWQFATKRPGPNALDSSTANANNFPIREPVGGKSDYPMAGGSPGRNMVNLIDKDIPSTFDLEKNLKWKAQLGSRSYGGPTVAGGRIFCGTNNENPRNPRDRGKPTEDDPMGPPLDKGILMCFDEKTGGFLWQAVHDKRLGSEDQDWDWPRVGVGSTPIVEGDRVYYCTNRCTVVCADVNGFANGNQGFQDEKYKDKIDADIIWEFDMIKELNVFAHKMTFCMAGADACSPLIVGDLMFLITGNGVDEISHVKLPSPDAPSFLCLNKLTGKVVWKSSAPGKKIMHGQWSHPAFGVIHGVPQVIFPGGDGWLYAFTPETGVELWRFDANPKVAQHKLGGQGERSDFIAMPVIHQEKVFIGVGQDPLHVEGIGHFWCIDPGAKRGDVSPDLVTDAKKGAPDTRPNPNSAAVWHYGGVEKRPFARRECVFGRTMSTACIVDGICYISELKGYLHALDATTGKKYWQFDLKADVYGSPYFADGKIFIGTEDGDLFVFRHDPKPEVMDEVEFASLQPDERSAKMKLLEVRKAIDKKFKIAKIEFDDPIRTTPIVANGVLYIMTEKTLFAVQK